MTYARKRHSLTIAALNTDDRDVERVAKAIYYGTHSSKKPLEYRSDDYKEKFREQAWRVFYELAYPF